MRSRGIILLSFLLAAACSAANPPAADGNLIGDDDDDTNASSSSSSGRTDTEEAGSKPESDAGADKLDAADAFDGFYPPPPSQCNPDLTIGAPTTTTAGARFAGITRDELTVAWTAPNEEGKTSLFIAERDSLGQTFGAPEMVSADAAEDSVALTDDGLAMVAVAADHRSFVFYQRPDRDTAFAVGDDTIFDNVIASLEPEEKIGDPVFIQSDYAFLYSRYGKSADTMRMANRVSVFASYDPTYTLAFDEFRASGQARRRPTGTGPDFQVIFYWDEISQTEKLARLNGTEMILNVKELGAHPWSAPNASCTKVYFGGDNVYSATAD